MRRREPVQRGWVNFPLDRPNGGEGGTFVRLVVCEPLDFLEPHTAEWGRAWEGQWMLCCGGGCNVLRDEELLGDDLHPAGPEDDPRGPALDFHFPLHRRGRHPNPKVEDRLEPFVSRPYLACVTLGSTGWNDREGRWRCRPDDLTEEGKALCSQLRALYPGCTLVLQTWLDT